MGRLWIGIGLLLALLAIGIGMLAAGSLFFREISENLEQAGDAALSGSWQIAAEKASLSQHKWETYRRFWSAFTDHEPVEEMQKLFAQLEIFRQRQMEVDFAAVCRDLSHLADAIEETHSLYWWSLL